MEKNSAKFSTGRAIASTHGTAFNGITTSMGIRRRNGWTRDQEDLAYFGKKQQLRRSFGIVSIVGLTCTLMITWEALLFSLNGSFFNGGPVGLIGGYLIAWSGNVAQALVFGELGSMIPLAGGEYNWVAVLAPKKYNNFLSYITGWITIIGWNACSASASLIVGTMIQGIAVLNYPNYVPERWHAVLLFYALAGIAIFINTYLARMLPQIESCILVLHIIGFFALLIPLVYLAPHDSVQKVFTTTLNEGKWPTYGLAFCIGVPTTAFCFIGLDGAVHMAEEIEDAASVIPKAMIITVLLNGALGFAMLIAVLFCLGDVDAAINTATKFPFMHIFHNATQSRGAATAMICVVLVALIFATIGGIATGSRMIWAFARENGVPFSSYISRVEPRSKLPLWAISTYVSVILLLALVNIASTTAFTALTGLTIASFYCSFTIAASVMLWRRCTTDHTEFRWGPFRLGRYGNPVYVYAIIYSLYCFFFSFFPPSSKVTSESMNWSVLVFFGVLMVAMVHWWVHANKIYTGPIIEILDGEAVEMKGKGGGEGSEEGGSVERLGRNSNVYI